MRFRAPASVLLHRAQLILILAALVPTILTTPIGIILLASGGSSSVALIAGILVLAFGASALTGYILGSLLLRRGALLVQVQTEFLSTVSHELRTPMTSMQMFIEALLDKRLTDPTEREKCLTALHRETVRLDGLVGRLIELSRIETGRHPFELLPVEARDIIESSLAALDAIALGAEPVVDWDVEPDLWVFGDRAGLTQVFVNLLSNAWKYTGEHKEIRFAAKAADGEVEFSVCDNGPGIPADEQARVFEKFERGKTAIAAGISGSGLGLAIVQAVVRAHQGRVELRSSPGRGSCFHVFLPRASKRAGKG